MKLRHLISSVRLRSAAIVAAGLMAGGISASAQSKYGLTDQAAAAKAVIDRFIGEGSGLNVTVSIDLPKASGDKDQFSYSYVNGTLNVQASSGVAACRGFYDFVKSNGAGISSWSSKRFQMPTAVEHSTKSFTSPYRDHQYMNVVTFGYSTPYWDEKRWMEEIDWMALHGIDMPLMLLASEGIYRKVFEGQGVTSAELDAWEVGPAHLPWMRMGNLCGTSFDGPLGTNWHDKQKAIAKAVLKRMGELGMKPIVPAFGGFVPPAYAQRLGDFSTTGWDWVIRKGQGNTRITPANPKFKEIGKEFTRLWDEEFEDSYGKFQYYLSDSFNEMTVPTDLDELANYGEQIFKAIQEGSDNENAVWVTQGWTFIYDASRWNKGGSSDAQYRALRSKVPAHQFMSLYMSPEYEHANWNTYANFCGDDWNYTMLPNMGGDNYWTGILSNYAQNYPKKMAQSQAKDNCTGWGMTMEGIEHNELLYELIADMGWTDPATGRDLTQWISEYGKARYGAVVYDQSLQNLHNTLRNTVYNAYANNAQMGWQGYAKGSGYYNAGNVNGANSDAFFQGFETYFTDANMQKLREGGELSDPLRNDLIEFAAFYASKRIEKACARITTLNNQGKTAEALAIIDQVDRLMYNIDYALSGHSLYDLKKWEDKAVNLGDTEATKEKYRKNARRIVSTWYGIHSDFEQVNDYAGRVWSGLIRDYYRPRLVQELHNLVEHTNVSLRDIERGFVPNGDNDTPAPPLTNPKYYTKSGTEVQNAGFDANTSVDELLTFLQDLVEEAQEAGKFVVEKNELAAWGEDEKFQWYFINSNYDKYYDSALTLTNGKPAKGDVRVKTNTGANSQIWRIIDNGDETYRLENRDGQTFSWTGDPKTYIANINSDVKFDYDATNMRYAILPQALNNQALHISSGDKPIAYGYRDGDRFYDGSTWTLADANGAIELVEATDRARILSRISGFEPSAWGNADLYGQTGQPNSAEALAAMKVQFSTNQALDTYTQYLKSYEAAVAENFKVPTDPQARKLFDLIASAVQLNPGSNPTSKAALRTALLTAQQALADGETGNDAKARIAPLQAAVKAFIDGAVSFPYVSAAPQNGKFVEGSTVITLKCKNGGGYITKAAMQDEAFRLTSTTEPNSNDGYWVVSGDDTNGYSFYNVAEGASKVLGFIGEEGNARAKLYNASAVPDGVTTKFKYTKNNNGEAVFYTGDNNAWNNFAKNGWLALWKNGSTLTTDVGSAFIISTVEGVDLGPTAGGEVTPPTSPTATITAVFPNDVRHQLYYNGTSITAAAEVPASGVKDFVVESYDETTGNIVLKVDNKFFHWLCDENSKSETSGLNADFDETLNTLVLEPADFGNNLHTSPDRWNKTADDVTGLYQLKGKGKNKTDNYYTLRQKDDHFISANPGERWFDSNYDGVGCRTSFFDVQFTKPTATIEPKYVTAPEIRDLAATGRFAILGVTTTGDHYINGEAGTGRVSTSSNLADARAPRDNEIVYFVSAGNDQYYIQREDNKKYIKATTSNLSLVESTSEATPFYILGKGEANYGNISGYDQLYADITEHPNDLMIRFKNGGNWLNTQGSTATGKLHSGAGAWSFEYVYYLGEQGSTPEEPVIDLGAYEGEITTKYPFVLSTSADDMHWHYLTIRGNKYVRYNASTTKFSNDTAAPTGDAGLFAFVPVSENTVKIVNKALGLTKAIGGTVVSDGIASVVDYASGLEFIYQNNEGHDVFAIKNADPKAHVNDIRGQLGFWVADKSATDDGSTFIFTPTEVLVSTDAVKHYYTIRNANPDGGRDKTYAHYEAANQHLSLGTERNNKTVFYFTSAGDNANGSQLVHIHSYLAEDGLTMANFNVWNTSNKAWYVKLANGTSALTDFNIGFNADYSSSWNHQTGGVKSWSAGADKGSAWYIEEVFEKTYTLDLSAADVEGYTLYNNGQAYTDGQQITGFFFDAASFTTDEAGLHPFDGTLTTVDGTLVFGFEEFNSIAAGTRPAGVSQYTLWYDEPSSKTTAGDKWMDYGLPIGNGQVGAVLAGDLLNDEIQFNEKSLWRGDSRYNGDGGQGYYQNFGFINVKDLSGNFSSASATNPVKGYNRYLDIVNGVAGVNYSSETTHFERTFITSAPDRVFAAHYTADGDQKLHLKFAFTPDTQISAETPVYGEDGTASFGGKLATVSYNANFKVVSTDGQVTRTDDGIEVSGATDVTLYMAAGTNFDITNTSLVNGDKGTVKTRNEGLLAAAVQKGWAAILDGHKADFSEYMNRVDIQFGDADSEKNTKELIDLYATPANRTNPDGLFLEQLYYTYGRYLAVAGNRINDTAVPTNLQGIWNKYSNSSFWHCDLHADINVEMNYWPMETANLSEMHRPFLDHILGLSKEGYAWRDLAKRVKSDARGWTIGTENNIFGGRSNFADNLKTQSAWYCSHLWQHYQYTLDKDFLREAFPTMLSSLQFLMDISTLNTTDNTKEVLHEWSPEHGDGNQVTAYAQQCVAENIKEVLAAVDILGSDVISADDLAEIVAFDKVADKGLNTEEYNGKTCLKEWKYLPLSHNDPAGHRHLSHLMALYPFSLVSVYDTENNAIYEATKNSLHVRNGGDVTGWSMGWKTNCYARTREGDEAHNYLAAALRHVSKYDIAMSGAGGCYYNLWDAHSPFQIDGNFGVTAGVNEMLLQSFDGTIHLLPALPEAWADGHAKGLKAIGNFTVDQTWAGGELTEADITSHVGGDLKVHYGTKELTIANTLPGCTYHFDLVDGVLNYNSVDASIVTITDYIDSAQGNDSYAPAVLQQIEDIVLKKVTK